MIIFLSKTWNIFIGAFDLLSGKPGAHILQMFPNGNQTKISFCVRRVKNLVRNSSKRSEKLEPCRDIGFQRWDCPLQKITSSDSDLSHTLQTAKC